MKHWIHKHILYIAGAVTGAIAGYLYWKYVGCVTGTCAITGRPLNSTLYFSAMGALLFGMFTKDKQKEKQDTAPGTE